MGKGSQTTTNQTTSAPDPQAAAAYQALLQRANGVASTPYQAYSGELTAPVNSQQQAGINGINAASNYAQPYVQQAAGLASGAASPLTASQIQNYQNPYTQNVVDATQAQFNNQNAQGQQSLTGNAIAQGALGGNRVGVAQANLSGQQQLAQAPVIAGLYQQSYNTGLQTAAQQYQQNPLAAANSIANFGISGQGAALSGAGAQLGAGTLQQQTQQAQDTSNYGQYQQAQAYPYQQAQWLAGLQTGVGSNLGGTSSGSTTAPAPNPWSQIIGTGVAAAGMFLNRGGAVKGYAEGGGVAPQHLAGGGVSGTPWSDAQGWIPQISIHGGSGAPNASAPSAQQQPAFDATKFASGLAGLGKMGVGDKFGAMFNPEAYGAADGGLGSAYGGSSSNPLPGLSAADYGEGFARGGVAGYADGGSPGFDDRFAPATEDPFGDMSRGQGLGLLAGTHGGVPAPASIPGGEPPPDPNAATWDDGQGPVRLYGQRPSGDPAALKGTGVAPSSTPGPAPDDEDVPAGAEPTAGKYPSIGVAPAQYTPPYAITPEDYAPSKKDPENTFGLGWLSPNAKTALLTAGLGMLASRSSNLGNAIGEGGLAGLSAYGSAEQTDRKAAEDARKLSLEAKQAANTLAHQTFSTNESARHANVSEDRQAQSAAETARHNQASEKQAAINGDRTKFSAIGSIITPEGSVHPLVMDTSSTTAKTLDVVTGKPPSVDDKIISKNSKGPVNDGDAKSVAEYYVKTGDQSRLNSLGVTSEARQRVQHFVREVQERDKVSDEELGTRVAEWAGRKAGQRTLGTQEAKMGSAAMEAEGAIGQARGVIERLPRTSFLPLNKLIQGSQSNTLNPDQAELYGRTQAIVNTYSAVMARGANVTTDSARGHAEALLNTASNPEVYNRMLDTMLQEIAMAKNSPARMREFYRKEYGPQAAPPEPGAAVAPAAGGFTPPPGAIPQTHGGKTYYYDPTTKKPYPGQS